jgi:hypothetical protein
MTAQSEKSIICNKPRLTALHAGIVLTPPLAISFPEHARSQVKGGHSSGEIELIQACDWLTADSTLDFQRELLSNCCKI